MHKFLNPLKYSLFFTSAGYMVFFNPSLLKMLKIYRAKTGNVMIYGVF